VDDMPDRWHPQLAEEIAKPYWLQLQHFVHSEREQHDVFPPADLVFAALQLTPFNDVRVVILGQDPYHGEGQAHGLAFSVQDGVAIPPSLRNIFKELHRFAVVWPHRTTGVDGRPLPTQSSACSTQERNQLSLFCGGRMHKRSRF